MGNPKGYNVSHRDGKLTATLYQTDIVEVNGKSIILRSGGWETKHTKKCINLTFERCFLRDKVRVYQKDFVWYVEFLNQFNTVETVPFQDGIRLEVA